MKVYEITVRECFGSAITAANSIEEAIKVTKEWDNLEKDLKIFVSDPKFYAKEVKDLEYKGEHSKVLYGFIQC